jgi:hypothetical protein
MIFDLRIGLISPPWRRLEILKDDHEKRIKILQRQVALLTAQLEREQKARRELGKSAPPLMPKRL